MRDQARGGSAWPRFAWLKGNQISESKGVTMYRKSKSMAFILVVFCAGCDQEQVPLEDAGGEAMVPDVRLDQPRPDRQVPDMQPDQTVPDLSDQMVPDMSGCASGKTCVVNKDCAKGTYCKSKCCLAGCDPKAAAGAIGSCAYICGSPKSPNTEIPQVCKTNNTCVCLRWIQPELTSEKTAMSGGGSSSSTFYLVHRLGSQVPPEKGMKSSSFRIATTLSQ